jgi:hypothetical protein
MGLIGKIKSYVLESVSIMLFSGYWLENGVCTKCSVKGVGVRTKDGKLTCRVCSPRVFKAVSRINRGV